MLEAIKYLSEKGVTPVAESSWEFHFDVEEVVRECRVRDEYIRDFGFAIPCEQALQAILRGGHRILEIGAGSGYWSYELAKTMSQSERAWLRVTDAKVGRYNGAGHWSVSGKQWIPVETMDAVDAVKSFGGLGYSLLTVWPDYNKDWAYKAVQEYFRRGGSRVYYVGEGDGGCTADDQFHEFMSKHYHLEDEIGIPQFWGIHDRLYCYRRD